MADEFQAGVCGGSWWNSSRSIFGSSLCASSHVHDPIGNNFAWPSHDLLDMKSSRSNSDESVVLQELPKNDHQHHDSSLQMLGIGLSSSSTSSTPDWNHTLIHGNGRTDSSYTSIIQEDLNSSLNYRQETGVDCPEFGKNFSTINEEPSSNSFKQVNQDFITLGHQSMNSITSSCTQDSTHVMNDSSFSNYPSALIQSLFDNDPPAPQQQQQHQSLFTNNNQPINFPLSLNYRPNLNDHFSPSLPKFPSLVRPSLPKQTPLNHFPFSNATSIYNTSTNLLPSLHSQFLQPTFNEKSSYVPNVTAKSNVGEIKESRSSSMAKKSSNEPAHKRPRIETPSPLPTFKVRKEKLGDRITALQQLVSPFGKTDTASVLHEAIEYIKFLHDQVNVLSTPYLKNGSPPQHQQTADKDKDRECSEQDFRNRGLCLVPISSTLAVATETTTDFWTPTFGGTFR